MARYTKKHKKRTLKNKTIRKNRKTRRNHRRKVGGDPNNENSGSIVDQTGEFAKKNAVPLALGAAEVVQNFGTIENLSGDTLKAGADVVKTGVGGVWNLGTSVLGWIASNPALLLTVGLSVGFIYAIVENSSNVSNTFSILDLQVHYQGYANNIIKHICEKYNEKYNEQSSEKTIHITGSKEIASSGIADLDDNIKTKFAIYIKRPTPNDWQKLSNESVKTLLQHFSSHIVDDPMKFFENLVELNGKNEYNGPARAQPFFTQFEKIKNFETVNDDEFEEISKGPLFMGYFIKNDKEVQDIHNNPYVSMAYELMSKYDKVYLDDGGWFVGNTSSDGFKNLLPYKKEKPNEENSVRHECFHVAEVRNNDTKIGYVFVDYGKALQQDISLLTSCKTHNNNIVVNNKYEKSQKNLLDAAVLAKQ
jgi:hypothetical protein